MGKPILFNTEMVKAILEGKKTSTRRPVKRTPSNDEPCGYGFWKEYNERDNRWYIKDYTHSCTWWTLEEYISRFSKYHVGDILYVRETWAIQSMSNFDKRIKFMYKVNGDKDLEIRYVDANRYEELLKYESKNGWNPSLFMPKEAARLFLKVTDVRIERLQDISEHGAIKEGCKGIECKKEHDYTKDECCGYCNNSGYIEPPQLEFLYIWDSIYSKQGNGWSENPYVWVIEFERVEV